MIAVSLLSALICHYDTRVAVQDDARVAYLRAHETVVRSISPGDRDFSDLEPVRAAIGARRIVMLGEESHGDGATFLAKSRLIEFLHERMGFNVLAFESGFYDVHRAWDDLASGADATQAIRSGIFSLWTNVQETQALWQYVAAQSRTNDPLILAGIDSQFTGTASKDHFLKDLDAVLDSVPQDPQLVAARKRVNDVLSAYFARGKGYAGLEAFQKQTTVADQARFYLACYTIGERLASRNYADPAAAARRDFWVQVLASTGIQMEHLWHEDFKKAAAASAPADWATFNLRDRQMAENLVWLARHEYANEKLIVWAATSHEMRRRQSFTNEYAAYVPMGDWVDRQMGADVYTIGFTAFSGRAGMGDAQEIGTARPGSLEGLIHQTGQAYVFLDFRHLDSEGAWLMDPLPAWPLGYQTDTTSWPAVMDGLFYITTMTPSTPVALRAARLRRAFGSTAARSGRTTRPALLGVLRRHAAPRRAE